MLTTLAIGILAGTLGGPPSAVHFMDAGATLRPAAVLAGHQPIISLPNETTGAFMEWPDNAQTGEVHLPFEPSAGYTVTITVDPPIRGFPKTIEASGSIAEFKYKTPSQQGYYTFTAVATSNSAYGSFTYSASVVMLVTQPNSIFDRP